MTTGNTQVDEMKNDEMKNNGLVRGGSNEHARLFLNIEASSDEEGAIAEGISEKFILPLNNWGDNKDGVMQTNGVGIYIKIFSRRAFSLVPSIVRWSIDANRSISIAHWDGEANCRENYPKAGFFKAIAEAACFYTPPK